MSISIRSLVLVSSDPESKSRGAQELFDNLQQEISAFGLQDEIFLTMVGDMGRHDALPMVIVYPEAVIYGPVKPTDVHFLVEEHLYKGRIVAELQASAKELTGRIAWLSARKGTLPAEQRIVLRRAGLIDPDDIEDYIAHDGYEALGKALSQMPPRQVIQEITDSGLRGRGGAGFPTGTKWSFVAQVDDFPKYVICNADESEPGTFKDRMVLEGDPHSMIEAMALDRVAVHQRASQLSYLGEDEDYYCYLHYRRMCWTDIQILRKCSKRMRILRCQSELRYRHRMILERLSSALVSRSDRLLQISGSCHLSKSLPLPKDERCSSAVHYIRTLPEGGQKTEPAGNFQSR